MGGRGANIEYFYQTITTVALQEVTAAQIL